MKLNNPFETLRDYLVLLVIFFVVCIAGFLLYRFIYVPIQEAQKSKVIVEQQGIIKSVNESNQNLREGFRLQRDSDSISTNLLDINNKEKDNLQTIRANNLDKVNEAVSSINNAFNSKLEKTNDPVETAVIVKEKEKAISQARLQLLWKNYCRDEPSDPDCRGIK
jgi:hypothetical protein